MRALKPPSGSIGLCRLGLAPLQSGLAQAEARDALMSDLERPSAGADHFADLPSTQQALTAMVAKRAIARASKKNVDREPTPLSATKMAELRDEARRRSSFEVELRSALQAARAERTGVSERLVLHWSNHFTVSSGKGKVKWSIGPYSREVARPHFLGPFEAMLFAAVTHPSMLYYLDNAGSIGPTSIVGSRRERGLNENLAREVLELHTLGVDGGYDQADVTALAKILTGWTVDIKPDSPTCGTTVFDERRHEPGAKTLLGRTFAEDGPNELKEALRFLATHPSTARNVARRLVGSFLGVPAPPEATAAIVRSFETTGGDLRAVTIALVDLEAMWTAPARKMRAPIEMLYIADRLIQNTPTPPKLVVAMEAMGQPFLRAPSPKGWAEEDEAWLSSDGIKSRLDWASEVGRVFGGRFPADRVAEASSLGVLSFETAGAIRSAETRDQALAMLLMSPELQRR